MILFLTISLRISTEVPDAPCAPFGRRGTDVPEEDATESDCSDCTSHSLESEPFGTVGVVTYGKPLAEDTVFAFAAGLKEERRFCAEDFLRMDGRCMSMDAVGAMDITLLKAAAICRRCRVSRYTA